MEKRNRRDFPSNSWCAPRAERPHPLPRPLFPLPLFPFPLPLLPLWLPLFPRELPFPLLLPGPLFPRDSGSDLGGPASADGATGAGTTGGTTGVSSAGRAGTTVDSGVTGSAVVAGTRSGVDADMSKIVMTAYQFSRQNIGPLSMSVVLFILDASVAVQHLSATKLPHSVDIPFSGFYQSRICRERKALDLRVAPK